MIYIQKLIMQIYVSNVCQTALGMPCACTIRVFVDWLRSLRQTMEALLLPVLYLRSSCSARPPVFCLPACACSCLRPCRGAGRPGEGLSRLFRTLGLMLRTCLNS